MNPKLRDAPANTWVKLGSERTGARAWPVFYFDPKLGKFVVSGGEAKKEAHADTEHFDAGSATWVNVYPPDAPYRAASGPSDAPAMDFRANTVPLKADRAGVMRIVRNLNPYEWDPGLFHQWAYHPDDGRVYAYFMDATLVFDPKNSTWADMKVHKFSQSHNSWLIYGSLAHDPIHQQLVSIGGTSDQEGGTPGTWTFGLADKEWRQLRPGSKELRELNSEARSLCAAMARIINACRNRFYVTESQAEAKQDLAGGARGLSAATDKLLVKLKLAKLAGLEAGALRLAMAVLQEVRDGVKVMPEKLGGKIDGQVLIEAQVLLNDAERAARILDAEPCGRAAAPAVTCYGKGKIVLFGGCRMDGYLADTWVYDCKTRAWEQRFPKICPAPRAGQVMAWLPKSQKVVLYGAVPFASPYGVPHGNRAPPRDLWTYDVDKNEWKRLAGPSKDSPSDVCGAVDPNDVLIAIGRDPKNSHSRVTWGMTVDPATADDDADEPTAAPCAVTTVFDTPADFDRISRPAADAVGKLLKDLPANQWTLMPKPPKSINSHPWGVTPYDTLRHQWISFGGGHSAWHFNDVAHYSLRTATWSWGFGEEFPYANASFCAFFNQTFNNRPTVPTHVWNGAAFDEVSGKVVYCIRDGTWVYDPATRAWEYPPVWGSVGGTKADMKGTPRGVVYWDANGGLRLYDVRSRLWSKLPVRGEKLASAYGDTGGMCYDPKRGCLWLSHRGSPMMRYDMKTGELTRDSSAAAPATVYMRGTAYVPELDMLLNVGRVSGPDQQTGNLVYDIEHKKWIAVRFPCSDGQARVNDKPYSSISLSLDYDPGLRIAVFHSNAQEVLVSRISKAELKPLEH
jgi:hypothetical protein